MQQTRDGLTVTRLFGEAYESSEISVIPVAVVPGGGGGGGGEEGAGPDGVGAESGSGGGFALAAKPAGVYVVDGNRVSSRPAVDVNRIILGAQIVGIVALWCEAFSVVADRPIPQAEHRVFRAGRVGVAYWPGGSARPNVRTDHEASRT
jgi:uncharacterized spore protein YtfJ